MRITPSRTTLRHPAAIAAAVLALTLAAVPFLPDGNDPQGSITPSAEGARTPDRGVVTPEMRAEIERVVAAGASLGRADGRTAAAQEAARCATFEGQRYCLGVGWTNRSPEEVAARLSERTDAGARAHRGPRRRRPPRPRHQPQRGRPDQGGARRADRGGRVGRQGVDAAPRDPGRAAPRRLRGGPPRDQRPRRSATTTRQRASIIKGSRSLSQNRTYWCGPATMQAIGWGSSKERTDQAVWARRLRTTSAGTAITDLVRVINNHTKYDRKKYAGTYIALDIGDFTFQQWYRLMMRHIHDYRAPVVLHPVLLKQYYPYLDDDASGHFQVGRGYDQNPDGNRQIGYFEPWDQSRFDPSEPAIDRVQWRNAYKSYRANLDHFQQNVGV